MCTGDKITVSWTLKNEYYPRVIKKVQIALGTDIYTEDVIETLDLQIGTWGCRSVAQLLSICVSYFCPRSTVSQIPDLMFHYFGSKPLLEYQVQLILNYVRFTAFNAKQVALKRTAQITSFSEVLNDTKSITSHSMNNTKVSDDQTLERKARISLQGNQEISKRSLRPDCSM